jgi:hypothetical protein
MMITGNKFLEFSKDKGRNSMKIMLKVWSGKATKTWEM